MPKIEWDQPSDRIYEVGLDHGVLYLENDEVVPWNGLVSVVHEVGSQSTEPVFFDGRKIGDIQNRGSLSVGIKALTYPDAFAPYCGVVEPEQGLLLPGQHKKSFSMTYRTLIGDGAVDLELGYRIHILYNLTATLDSVSNVSIGDSVDPIAFEWAATTKEEILEGYSPTAYVIADSRYLSEGALEYLNYMLYGSVDSSPFLPDLTSLVEILDNSFIISIVDNGDGTWTASGPDERITRPTANTFQITDVDATYLDADTYEVSST